MVSMTRIRYLRLKYRIPLIELSRISGVSWQRLSNLELGKVTATPRQEKRIAEAMEGYLSCVKEDLVDLELNFLIYKGHLYDLLEVEHEP